MKQLLTLFLVGKPILLHAQEKGLTPLQSGSLSDQGSTYVVVVRISDYQDERIPDLRFAHRDANAFAQFLRSPAGWKRQERN